MLRCWLAFIANGLLASLTFAAPITYQESVSGDLGQPTPLTTFTLDIGVNTVSGTTGIFSGFTPEFDSFAFVVPAGMEVFVGDVTTTDTSVPGSNLFLVEWSLGSGSNLQFGGTLVQTLIGDPPFNQAFSPLPLGPGTYNISASRLGGNLTGGFPVTANYTFTFEVRSTAPIPEPATLTFFGGMMAFGGVLARRRRQMV